MNQLLSEYIEQYTSLGLNCIPIEWDIEKKEAVSHRLWSDDKPLKQTAKHNALMVKTKGQYAAIDFDLKNTERKTLFDEWLTIVKHEWPEILDKVFIEQTRNKGYHVWVKYEKLNKKMSMAQSDIGSEVIALYACTPLVYTYPTPGYSEIKNSMYDVQLLTDKEFDFLIKTSQAFNEYKPTYDPNSKAVNYPKGFEKMLINFDTNLPDEYWTQLLSEIGLVTISNYKYHQKDKFTAFRRTGSTSEAISAKVYYKSKRVLIFSASLHDYPNWHNRHDFEIWSLPPSFVLFYKLNRDWKATIEYINSIIDSIGMQNDFEPISAEAFTGYPMHVFPECIKNSILDVCSERSLAPQFVATAGLWTISTLAGTMYNSDFNGDARNILFCLLIAPVSVGKTPAFKVMCEYPLKKLEELGDREYEKDHARWLEEKAKSQIDKKPFLKKEPERYVPVSSDGTTEGYLTRVMKQRNGVGVYMDEAETIFNAGSFKGTNDSISFFTQAFGGGRVAQIRADESKTRIIPDLNLNLLMGTQPLRLKNIFTEDRLSSGFASRFLMVESDYLELNEDSDPFSTKKEICQEWVNIISYLYNRGLAYNSHPEYPKCEIRMSDAAKNLYRHYYRENLVEANKRIKSKAENYIIGTEAKMSAYFPRLVQVLSILYNPEYPEITEDIVHKGWQLYKFYACETIRVIAGLHGEIETGLPKELELLYQALPDQFTSKDAKECCVRINLPERRFEVSIRRKDFSALFNKIEHGKYTKK